MSYTAEMAAENVKVLAAAKDMLSKIDTDYIYLDNEQKDHLITQLSKLYPTVNRPRIMGKLAKAARILRYENS